MKEPKKRPPNQKIILTVEVSNELDIVLARQRARQIAELLGFKGQELTRIATAVSEIARNAFIYASRGKVEFLVEDRAPSQMFLARISDKGPGIEDLKGLLDGQRTSETGMGLGIVGARRLMDSFHIESAPDQGTTVLLGKSFSPRMPSVSAHDLVRIAGDLERMTPHTPLEELQQQNQELLRTLEELTQLNRELEDTNRGVVALYTELDEKAERLQKADELKSRFLSHTSHELRSPLGSILSLSKIMLDRTDGELTAEQEKQVGFIRKATEHLSELINELLDLAKIEAGKMVVRAKEFEIEELFGSLKAMVRPLHVNPSVQLIFEDPVGIPPLNTDDGKVMQILRNLITNALKFTEKGEIHVSATINPEGHAAIFTVTDTGIGIALEDQERIFEEYVQIETPLQKGVKGTGLGLSLSRKLAEFLGGSLSVTSEKGVGSTFTAVIPLTYEGFLEETPTPPIEKHAEPSRLPVLVVEDEPSTMAIYEIYLKGSPFRVIPAYTLREARDALKEVRPVVIILDILLHEEDGWDFLTEMKQDKRTRDIPVLVVTIIDDQHEKGMILGADGYCVKPVDRSWLLRRLEELDPLEKILIVDDEQSARYTFKKALKGTPYSVIEAADGPEGLRKAREEQPQVIFLDLLMPGMNGFEVLQQLKSDPATQDIPVIIFTSKELEEEDRLRLSADATAILFKQSTSRQMILAQIRDALERVIQGET
jgi:signal transduction histidine kinase/CheY-like chemotaxis protein